MAHSSNGNNTYNNSGYVKPMNKSLISMDNIKYDLLKIAEPYDGVMFEGSGYLINDLFAAYLNDLQDSNLIYSWSIPEEQYKENSVTYDVIIQLTEDRSPKKLKIHVGVYKSKWPDIKDRVNVNA